jgi:hypothetical protein
MLVLHGFREHLSDELMFKLESKNCDLPPIRDVMTSHPQPLDVSDNP